jgi:hypothetical protein
MKVRLLKRQNLFLVAVWAAALCMPAVLATSSQIEFQIKPQAVLPFEAEAKVQAPPPIVTFKTNAQPGNSVGIRIDMPPETPWLSTDFPIVEGRTLFEIETPPGKDGSLSLRPMFPIRGDYTIAAETKDGAKVIATDMFKLHVSENPSKYWNFAMLAAFLFVIGLIGGWLIGGKQKMLPGQLAPTRVELLLSASALAAIVAMACLAVSAEMNLHQHCEKSEAKTETDKSSVSDNSYNLALSGNAETAVGELATFKAQVSDKATHKPAKTLPLQVTVTQLEENFVALTFAAVTNELGQLTWKECFFDGAPHRVEVRIDDGKDNGGVTASKTIAVEAIHPPLSRRLTTLIYMMMFLFGGLLTGFSVTRRAQARSASSSQSH